MLLKWLALTLKMRHVHAILREIRPFKISTPKGWRRIQRHSLNPVNPPLILILLATTTTTTVATSRILGTVDTSTDLIMTKSIDKL